MEKLHKPFDLTAFMAAQNHKLVFANGERVSHYQLTPDWIGSTCIVTCDKYGQVRSHYKDGRMYSTMQSDYDLHMISPVKKGYVTITEGKLHEYDDSSIPYPLVTIFDTKQNASNYLADNAGVIITTDELMDFAIGKYFEQLNEDNDSQA